MISPAMTARIRLVVYAALVVVAALLTGCSRAPSRVAHSARVTHVDVALASAGVGAHARFERFAPTSKLHASGHVSHASRSDECDDDDDDDVAVDRDDGLPGRGSDDDDTDDDCDREHRVSEALAPPASLRDDVDGKTDPTIRSAGAHGRATEHPPRT